MQYACIIYHNKAGTTAIPVKVDGELPLITNAVLKRYGVINPGLGRGYDHAHWLMLPPIEEWGTVKLNRYAVKVSRTAVRQREVEVEARTEKEAHVLALEKAGDCDFGTSSERGVKYEVYMSRKVEEDSE